jgi:hypothetical protein
MTLTPRQIAAYLTFNSKLENMDRQNDLMISAIGAQGDNKAIDKMLKELSAG